MREKKRGKGGKRIEKERWEEEEMMYKRWKTSIILFFFLFLSRIFAFYFEFRRDDARNKNFESKSLAQSGNSII